MTSVVQALAQSRLTRSGRDTEARWLNAAARILHMARPVHRDPDRLNEPGFRILRNSEGSQQSASLPGWARSSAVAARSTARVREVAT
jgi:hypothetical protein